MWEGPGLKLVELNVVEQRYHAVMEIVGGLAPRGHRGRRPSRGLPLHLDPPLSGRGLSGLAERSHRPHHHPWQEDPEALVCEMRRAHPKCEPRR